MIDVVVIGGGVCGLWTRAALHRAGFSTVLVSDGPLGSRQTVGSQGILHAGLKYAADGLSHEISRTLASSHEQWLAAMNGSDGAVDLRRMRVLSRCTHFWTAGGMLDRAVGMAASAVMKAGAKRLAKAEYPPVFAGAGGSVGVWEVQEEVVDPVSLVECLRDCPGGEIVVADMRPSIEASAGRGVRVRAGARTIEARHAVLAAGEGNEALLAGMGDEPASRCQRRPLHMVYAAGSPGMLFGHCLQLSDKPRLTITTGRAGSGLVWYIGGEIAEKGVARSEAEQVEAGRAELRATLPWIDQAGFRWGTVRIDRAEGRVPGGKRPDGPVLHHGDGYTAVWPTKLAMAPGAAALVLDAVVAQLGSGSSGTPVRFVASNALVAAPPWMGAGQC